MTFQQTIIIGNVGKDAELRYTPQGIAVTDFSVCVNKIIGKGEGRREIATWFKVTVWREAAESAAEFIRKGAKIMVMGEVKASAYTAKDGKPAASLELTASLWKFMESKKDASGAEPDDPQDQQPSDNDIPF